ncbi:hypothetical protein [Actinoplanes regularis]|uniref:hypothetical protein n=1 Tax=Actinoplanes regularis TaxID=52697 RepID=UPI0024A53314|nr:hypothetical protein [Actinoplanes regularis]GLW33673.1 hypothetical protein Areg01_66110 [Actinoplanes regularis]
MTLSVLIYLGATVFAVVCVLRLREWRSTGGGAGDGRRIIAPRHLARLATSALLAAAFGMVLITVLAAVLVESYQGERRSGGAFSGLQTLAMMVGVFVIVVPIANWLGLRVLGVRPAGLAAFGSWVLLAMALVFAQEHIPGGEIQPAWFYGFVALVPYAIATAAVVCVPPQAE